MYRCSKQDGTLLVHWAARLGDLKELKRLVKEEHSRLFEGDEDEQLPIHWAAQAGQLKTMQWMVEEECSLVSSSMGHGENCLHLAAAKGYLEMMEWLIAQDKSLLYLENSHSALPIHHAVYGGLEAVKLLVSYDPKLLRARGDFNDEYPIHFAVSSDNLEMVQWIISQDPSMLYKKSAHGDLPIHLAHSTIFEWLAAQDPQMLLVRNNAGCLPISSASLSLAQNEVFLDYQDEEGNTLLHLCSTELFEWILEKKPSLAHVKNNIGQLPIHAASMKGDKELIQKLIAFDPKSIEEQDDDWCLPLHFPNQPQETAQAMIAQKKELLYVLNREGDLPIHVSARSNEGLAEWMLDQDFSLAYQTDREKNTPLHIACQYGCASLVNRIVKEDPKLLKQENKYKDLPVHIAAEYGRADLFKELIILGPSLLTAPGFLGQLPVHQTQDFELLSWMVEKDPILLKKKDDWGRLFLHRLAYNEEFDLTANKWIPKENPDLEKITRWAIKKYPEALKIKDKWDKLPIDYAEDYKNFEFFKLLCQFVS